METATQAAPARQPKKQYEEVAPSSLAGRYMRSFWQPICLASQIKPGRALPIHALGESFTLYRTPDGACRLTEFRCPHRRTQLSTGRVEADGIRCLYHGWKFRMDGQCVEVPGEDNQNYINRIKLKTYPVQEYLGLIFAFVGDGEPPELPRFTAIETAGHIDASMYTREYNYFQNIENGVDEVHVNFTHSTGVFENSGLIEEVPQIQAEETSYGLIEKAIRSGDRVRETQFLMPNMLMLKLPPHVQGESDWRNYISWRVPISETLHMTFIVMGISVFGEDKEKFLENQRLQEEKIAKLEPFKDVARRVLAGEITISEVEPRPDLTGIQDYVTQIGQGIITDRSAERLGRSDIAIVLLRKLWDRELTLLSEGKPLTKWDVPSMLQPT